MLVTSVHFWPMTASHAGLEPPKATKRLRPHWVRDAAVACQHILLASAQLGFSSRRSRSLPGIRRILNHGAHLPG